MSDETCKKCSQGYSTDNGLTFGYCRNCQLSLSAYEKKNIIGFCPKCGSHDWHGSSPDGKKIGHTSCGICGWISRDFCPQCGRWHWHEVVLNQQGKCGACGYLQNCTPIESYTKKET
jgi:hypothetical protein